MRKSFLSGVIIIMVLLHSEGVFAQAEIRNLVMEGAGMRGLAYCGVIMELEDRGMLAEIEKVGGTSAGAINALALSLGYTANEVYDFVAGTDFQRFNDGKYWFVGGLNRMTKNYGWYRGDEFLEWLEGILQTKTGNKNITFSEMREAGFKDLYVAGTCLNKQKLVIFSVETYPDMCVKDAIRISMSVPLYFEAVFIDEHGKVYDSQDEKEGLDVMVDGGILGNYPIDMFDSYEMNDEGIKVRIPNPATLGIRLDSDDQIEEDSVSQRLAETEINDISQYIEAFYVLTLETINRRELIPKDWERTISVSSVGIGPRIKKLSIEDKNSLVSSGRYAAKRYFESR